MATDFFKELNKTDQQKIESILPGKIDQNKKLYRRTDKNGAVAYIQLPSKMEPPKTDFNFKFELCKSIAEEKNNLAKLIWEPLQAKKAAEELAAADAKKAAETTTKVDTKK